MVAEPATLVAATAAASPGAMGVATGAAISVRITTTATTVQLTGSAHASRCRYPLLVAGKRAAQSGARIDKSEERSAFAASNVEVIWRKNYQQGLEVAHEVEDIGCWN